MHAAGRQELTGSAGPVERRYPETTLPNRTDDIVADEPQDLAEVRAEKLRQIEALGIDPWGGRFDGATPIGRIRELPAAPFDDDRLLELEDALDRLAVAEPLAAQLVELRLFAGLSVTEAAAALKLSPATGYREYTFARAWLTAALSDNPPKV